MSLNSRQGKRERTHSFSEGLAAGVPVAIGYIPVAIACGILCVTGGLTLAESIYMSAAVYAGASQFVAINMMIVGAGAAEIVLATALLNSRLIMMSSTLSRKLKPGIGALKKLWIFFEMTDESFSVAAVRDERHISPDFMVGLNIAGHFTWTLGTALGYLGTELLPRSLRDSMGIAIYALFIALLMPSVKKSRPALAISLAAMAFSALLKWTPVLSDINPGMSIMIATGAAAAIGLFLYGAEGGSG